MYFASFSKRHATNLSWEQRKLSEVVKELKRTDEKSDAPVMMITAENGFINQSERYSTNNAGQSLKKYILLEKGELAYNHGASKLRPYGSCFALTTEEKARIPFVYHCFSTETENSEFLSIVLNGKAVEKQLRRIVSSGARMDGLLNISFDEYTSIPVMLPQKDEQDRIADYFKQLDNLITLHQCKHNYTPITFSFQKANNSTPSWEQRKLGEISNKVTKKNQDAVVDEVFTNSAEFGIISQRDFFEKDIANAENIDGYYVVESDDFVYNPRISTTAPFGPIKRNKLERTGAMSPLYYVFRPYEIDLSYLEWYFQTTCWHAFMRFNGNSGARSDRFAITDKIFNEMPISMPQDIEEQKLIGTFLTKLESLITLHQR